MQLLRLSWHYHHSNCRYDEKVLSSWTWTATESSACGRDNAVAVIFYLLTLLVQYDARDKHVDGSHP